MAVFPGHGKTGKSYFTPGFIGARGLINDQAALGHPGQHLQVFKPAGVSDNPVCLYRDIGIKGCEGAQVYGCGRNQACVFIPLARFCWRCGLRLFPVCRGLRGRWQERSHVEQR